MRPILFAALMASASPLAAQHEHHEMPVQSDPHAGHDMSAMEAEPVAEAEDADPHAGHDMSAMEAPADPPALPPPPGASVGPRHAAETLYDPADMAAARKQLAVEHGGMATRAFLVERLEARIVNGRDGYAWDGQFRTGGDLDALVIKSEGEGSFGQSPGSADVQALWSHAIAPFFDLQAGVRYDIQPDPERAHAVLGLQGELPYWIGVEAAAFLSTRGDLTARIELEHDARITQRFILQPRVEMEVSAQDIPSIGTGSGLATIAAGLRLRYEAVNQFMPYIGVEYERMTGATADYARAAGSQVGGWSALIGIRSNF